MNTELTDEQIEAVLNDSDLNLICDSEVHDKWVIKFARAVMAAHAAHRQATKLQWGQPSGCDLPTPAAFGPAPHSQGDQSFFTAQQMRDYVAADRAQRQAEPSCGSQTAECEPQTGLLRTDDPQQRQAEPVATIAVAGPRVSMGWAPGYTPKHNDKLFTAPPPAQVPLTTAQIWNSTDIMAENSEFGASMAQLQRIVHAVERLHGIRPIAQAVHCG
jgi:hypothetical protein